MAKKVSKIRRKSPTKNRKSKATRKKLGRPKGVKTGQGKKRVTGQILNSTLYVYVEKQNNAFARKMGRKPQFGTVSAFVNALIARARGVQPARGTKNQKVVSLAAYRRRKASSTTTKRSAKAA